MQGGTFAYQVSPFGTNAQFTGVTVNSSIDYVSTYTLPNASWFGWFVAVQTVAATFSACTLYVEVTFSAYVYVGVVGLSLNTLSYVGCSFASGV